MFVPGAVLAVLIMFHLLGVFLLPSFFLLLSVKSGPESPVRKFFTYGYPRFLTVSMLGAIALSLVLRPGPLEMLLVNPFHLFRFYNYAPYIIFHISEVLNLLLLGAGAGCFFVIWFRRRLFKEIKRNTLLNFLSVNAFFGLLLIVFFNPSGNCAADWDIMAAPLLMINLLGVYLLLDSIGEKPFGPAAGLLVSQVIIACLVWFSVNTLETPAAERIITIYNHGVPEGNPGLPLYSDGQTFKYYYFIKKDYRKSREIAEIALKNIENESLWEYANYMKDIGEDQIALQFVRKYTAFLESKIQAGDVSWSDYYNLAMNGYMILGRFGRAAAAFDEALRLNPENYELYFWIGQAHEAAGASGDALNAYIRYDSLFDEDRSLRLASRERTLEKIYQLSRRSEAEKGRQYFETNSKRGNIYILYLARLYHERHEQVKVDSLFTLIRKDEKGINGRISTEMARVYLDRGDLPSAWEMLQLNPLPDDKRWSDLMDRIKDSGWYRENQSGIVR